MENNQNPQMMNVPQNTDAQNVGQENMTMQPSLPEVQTGAVDNGEANVVSDGRTTILDPNAGKVANLIKIIAIVILSMTTLTFVGVNSDKCIHCEYFGTTWYIGNHWTVI